VSYVDGNLCAVPTESKASYVAFAEKAADAFKRYGATQVVECWGVEVPEGETNSMHTAVLRKPDETVVFSWIIWPSKAVRDAAWEKMQNDPMFADEEMPMDGQRMIFGGFDVIVER
jgi:uncharacterized protein YbaA (DUF1428 family)